MNTQLTEQAEQAPTMEQALELQITAFNAIQAANNASIDENNLLLDENERLRDELAFTKLQVKTLSGRINDVVDQNEKLLEARKNDEEKEKHFNKTAEVVRANAEKNMQQLDQALRQEQQSKNKLDDALFTIASYKALGSPKQIREKIKKYQATIESKQKAEKQYKLDAKQYRHDLSLKDKVIVKLQREADERDFQKIYRKNGDNLIIYPLLCETIIDNKVERQVPIWFSTDSGIGALYMLNEDGEPARSPTPKTGIKPKKETMEVMTTLLRKFKRNGNLVKSEDIRMLEVA